MKYGISLMLGFFAGAALAAVLAFYNPLHPAPVASLSGDRAGEMMTFTYAATPDDSLLYTNSGEGRVRPQPELTQKLWEPAIEQTTAFVTVLEDTQGDVAGIGIKFISLSEDTSLLKGRVATNSAWHIYAVGRGSLFVEQTENYWSYLKNVVLAAYRSSGDNWVGSWRGQLTSGPSAHATARVFGASGIFSGLETEASESLKARAYALDRGPVAAEGQINIAYSKPAGPEGDSN